MTNFKPMLAKDGNPSDLTYPVAGQIKYDGIRCSIVDGVAVSRTLKPIQNKEIQAALGRPEFNGLDGELIVGRPEAPGCMQASSSFVMSPDKTGADWHYFVFDKWDAAGGYLARHMQAEEVVNRNRTIRWDRFDCDVLMVEYTLLCDEHDLYNFEESAVAAGHEGVIVRTDVQSAPYKFGRSGKKGPLLKIKRFTDFEAEVVGVYEKMHNGNVAVTNALGRTERSSAKAGKVGLDTLGGFVLRAVNGPWEGVEFRCGTGFNDQQRAELWKRAGGTDRWPLVKVKAVEIGAKDAPRFPVFLGFRHEDDL